MKSEEIFFKKSSQGALDDTSRIQCLYCTYLEIFYDKAAINQKLRMRRNKEKNDLMVHGALKGMEKMSLTWLSIEMIAMHLV